MNTEEYQRVLDKNNVVDYEKYYNLLLVAAQRYDEAVSSNIRHRTFNQHAREDFPLDSMDYGNNEATTEYSYYQHEGVTDVTEDAYKIFAALRPQTSRDPRYKRLSNQRERNITGYISLPRDLW